MSDEPAVLIRSILGFQKDEGGTHALIGFQPMAGNPFALAFTPDVLTAAFAAVVNALGQFPMPRLANRPVCSIVPSWIELGEEGPEDLALTFRLDHGGSISFYLNKESAERLLELIQAAVRPVSIPPPPESATH
jgi:hypothetical protein